MLKKEDHRIIKWQNTVKTQLYLLAMRGWII